MGEIKSTLDLVMEKTKNLSLSAEEKTDQQRAAYQKRLKGLLQKYADGLQTLEEFQEQCKAIQKSLGVTDTQPLIHQILNHIDPDQDNIPWLNLLDGYMPNLRSPIQDLLSAYAQQSKILILNGSQTYLDQLKSNHSIEGSAVVPNLAGDGALQAQLATLRQDTRAGIAGLE